MHMEHEYDDRRSGPQASTRGDIVLAPHDVAWAMAFEREARVIRDALSSEVSVGVHHIGSTAIPGIAAKPVIDMLGVVSNVEVLDAHSHHVVALGYEALGEFGIAGRRYFRKNRPDGVRTHQLHVFARESPEVVRHLNFRDFQRAFPQEAAHYEALKLMLAARHGADMGAYSDGKTAFIRAVDARAAAWRSTGTPVSGSVSDTSS